ncbi:MAG: hypothetical protein LBO67_06510 [Spirochaetaceae bacterium]|nr:hypothetical protein [Spirochaetaceae bacterium]
MSQRFAVLQAFSLCSFTSLIFLCLSAATAACNGISGAYTAVAAGITINGACANITATVAATI